MCAIPVIQKKREVHAILGLGNKHTKLSQDPLTSFPLGTVLTFPVSPSTGGNEMKGGMDAVP